MNNTYDVTVGKIRDSIVDALHGEDPNNLASVRDAADLRSILRTAFRADLNFFGRQREGVVADAITQAGAGALEDVESRMANKIVSVASALAGKMPLDSVRSDAIEENRLHLILLVASGSSQAAHYTSLGGAVFSEAYQRLEQEEAVHTERGRDGLDYLWDGPKKDDVSCVGTTGVNGGGTGDVPSDQRQGEQGSGGTESKDDQTRENGPRTPIWDRIPLKRLLAGAVGSLVILIAILDWAEIKPTCELVPLWDCPTDTLIAFVSNRDGNNEIYVMNPDGSGQKRLTNHAANDEHPSLSPDGRRIAFASDRDGNSNIWVMNADGSGAPERLTSHEKTDSWPSWSTQIGGGHHIAFASNRRGNYDIYIMNADGTDMTRLTQDPADEWAPSISSDGTIAFVSYLDGIPSIYALADRSVRRMTDLRSDDRNPSWSPDGRRIVFQSHRDGSWNIYAMNADGSDLPKRLTDDNLAHEMHPSWSPDGRRIAFTKDDGPEKAFIIYTTSADADGAEPTPLTDIRTVNSFMPSWSP